MRSAALFVLLVAACASDPAPDFSSEQQGSASVGTTRFTATDDARARTLVIQAWYPTATPEGLLPIEMLEAAPVRAQYTSLLQAAPAGCPSHTTDAALDATPAAGSYPVVLFSHCHDCTRLSNTTTAARLASHGFVVLAVDHAGNTLWDQQAGNGGSLDSATLELRAGDVRFVLDQVAAGATPVSAIADLAHVGVFGHSFGAVTAGRVAQLDTRISAAAALCAPMENPLIAGVTLADIHQPVMFVVADEDNSITELGNTLIRNNFRDAPGAAWKLEVPDAGHWSVSDLDGLVTGFMPGCGSGVRQTDGTAFDYLDPRTGRAIAAAYVTAFFRATLEDDAGARAYLTAKTPAFGLQGEHR